MRTLHRLWAAEVSPPLTIPGLSVNVPTQELSRSILIWLVKVAHALRWMCFDPGGTRPVHFGGLMAAPGYRFGAWRVQS